MLSNEVDEAGFFFWNLRENRIVGDRAYAALYKFEVETAARGVSLEDVFQRIHPEDRDTLNRLMPATLKSAASYHQDYRLLLPDASVVHVQSTGRVFADRTGPSFCVGLVYVLAPLAAGDTLLTLCLSAHALATSCGRLEVASRLEGALFELASVTH